MSGFNSAATSKDLAVVHANLRGRKDLLAAARALDRLRRSYGTTAAVAKATGFSRELIREFLTLLELSPRVQQLIESRQLGLEQGRRLHQLSLQRPADVEAAAEAMLSLTAHDSRELVQQLRAHSGLSVREAVEAIAESKTVTKEEFHVIVVLDEADFARLSKAARRAGRGESEQAASIIRRALGHES